MLDKSQPPGHLLALSQCHPLSQTLVMLRSWSLPSERARRHQCSLWGARPAKKHISLCLGHWYFFFSDIIFSAFFESSRCNRKKYFLFQMWCRLYWTTLWKKGLQRFICGSRSSKISVCLNSSCDWNHPDCYHLCCSPLYYKVSISGILQ